MKNLVVIGLLMAFGAANAFANAGVATAQQAARIVEAARTNQEIAQILVNNGINLGAFASAPAAAAAVESLLARNAQVASDIAGLMSTSRGLEKALEQVTKSTANTRVAARMSSAKEQEQAVAMRLVDSKVRADARATSEQLDSVARAEQKVIATGILKANGGSHLGENAQECLYNTEGGFGPAEIKVYTEYNGDVGGIGEAVEKARPTTKRELFDLMVKEYMEARKITDLAEGRAGLCTLIQPKVEGKGCGLQNAELLTVCQEVGAL